MTGVEVLPAEVLRRKAVVYSIPPVGAAYHRSPIWVMVSSLMS